MINLNLDKDVIKLKAMETIDNVNHPKHYTSDASGVECIQIIRHRNFNIGNAIKYLWRAGLKHDFDKESIQKEIEDLNKAVWYIVDEIHRLGGICNVNTDILNTIMPSNNEDIVNSVLNYSVVVQQKQVTILGSSIDINQTKVNIHDCLREIIYKQLEL